MSNFNNESILEDLDLKVNVQIMDNKEKRIRVVSDDNTIYARTEQPGKGAWQNAHYHTSTNEMYIVQKGYIIMAIAEGDDVIFKRLEKNQFYNVGTNVSHNVFMGEDSVIHTIKYGIVPNDDWNYDEEIDKISKNYREI